MPTCNAHTHNLASSQVASARSTVVALTELDGAYNASRPLLARAASEPPGRALLHDPGPWAQEHIHLWVQTPLKLASGEERTPLRSPSKQSRFMGFPL